MGAGDVHLGEVNLHEHHLLFLDRGFGEKLPGRAGDETLAPELETIATDSLDFLVPDAVDRGDIATVGNRVRALDELPCAVLVDAVFSFLRRMPADGGRVENDFRALHGGEAGRLGIPLIPADEHADAPEFRIPGAEAGVAGGEVKLLVEKRIIRDVHLAVDAEHRAIGINDDRGVMIKSGGAFLEKRRDHDNAVFFGQLAEGDGAGPIGNRLGKAEIGVVLALAKILRAKHFLGADDLRAAFGRLLGEHQGLGEIGLGVGEAGMLEQPERDSFGGRHGRVNRRPC